MRRVAQDFSPSAHFLMALFFSYTNTYQPTIVEEETTT